MVSQQSLDAFYEGRRSERFPFAVNDSVVVVTGKKPGIGASVISLEAEAPEVWYCIEYGDDGSMDIVPVEVLRPYEKPA